MRLDKVRKMFTVILAAAMVVTMIPTTTYGAEETMVSEAVQESDEIEPEESVSVAETVEEAVSENAGNGIVEDTTQETPTGIANEDDYRDLEIIRPIVECENDKGEITYVSDEDMPTGSEDAYLLTINKKGLSGESDVEISYSETFEGEKKLINDSQKIPSGAYVWVRAKALATEKAIACKSLYFYSSSYNTTSVGVFYNTTDVVQCLYMNEERTLVFTEQDIIELSIDGEEEYTKDILIKRNGGKEELGEEKKVARGDRIAVSYQGAALVSPFQIKTFFQNGQESYITPTGSVCYLTVPDKGSVLHIEKTEQYEVTIQIPEELQEMVKISNKAEWNEEDEIDSGSTVATGDSIYIHYLGNEVENAAGIKIYYFCDVEYSYTPDYWRTQTSNTREISMPENDLTITASTYNNPTVKLTNDCPDKAEVYTDSACTQKVGESFSYTIGDKFWIKILENAPDGYIYRVTKISTGENGRGYSSYSKPTTAGTYEESLSLWAYPENTTEIKIELIRETAQSVITISNNYEDYVAFYEDEYFTRELRDGDTTRDTVYYKLLKPLEEGWYFVINGKELDNEMTSGFLKNWTSSITVSKRQIVNQPFTAELGDYSELLHFYKDENHTEEIQAGDLIRTGSRQLYVTLDTEQAEEDTGYQIRYYYISGGYSECNLDMEQPTGTIWIDTACNPCLSVAEVKRIQVNISNVNASYWGLYRNSSCGQSTKIQNGDYVTAGNTIYAKQLQDDEGTLGVVLHRKDEYENGSSSQMYDLTTDGVESVYTQDSTSIFFEAELYTYPKLHLNIAEKYKEKVKFYSDSNCTKELADQDSFAAGTDIYAKLTSESTGPVPVHWLREYNTWHVTALDGSEAYQYTLITSQTLGVRVASADMEDVELEIRDEYYFQIKENLKAGMSMYYQYSTDEGLTWKELESKSGWLPWNSRLKVTAASTLEDFVPVIRRRYTIDKRGYYYKTRLKKKALYSSGDSEEIILNDDNLVYDYNGSTETPIYVDAGKLQNVTVSETDDVQGKVSYFYNGGQVWTPGTRVATGDDISVEVSSVPENMSIRATLNAKVKDWETYDGGKIVYYWNYSEEGEYDSQGCEVCDDGVDIHTELVALRKVTLTKPEGYDICVSACYNDDEYSICLDPEDENYEKPIYVPDGCRLSFEGYYDDEKEMLPLKITNAINHQREGYVFYDSYTSVMVEGMDYNFRLEPVHLYQMTTDSELVDIQIDNRNRYRKYIDDDEETGEGIYATCIPYGETVGVRGKQLSVSGSCLVNVYNTDNMSEKVFENQHLTLKAPETEFIMPAFPVTVSASTSPVKAHTVNIVEKDFSADTSASYKVHGDYGTERLEDGDEVYEEQQVRVDADSIAANKKMLVTIQKTGTNEYATGSTKGILIGGIKSAVFDMFDFPVTIQVLEKDRIGTGNTVAISESLSSGTKISYSVENGNMVPENQEITLNVESIRRGATLAVNVICPDENMVASGSGITNDFSKPYYSKNVSQTGEIKFVMPDYPIDIQVREILGATEKIDISGGTVSMNQMAFEYTGKPICPEYNVLYNGYVLVKGEDYTESFSNNTEAGTAKLVLTGIGGCIGTLEKDFAIDACPLTAPSVTFTMSDKVIFNNKQKYEPKPVIRIGDFTLKENTHYTLSYENNTTVTDRAAVTVKGIGSMNSLLIKSQ